MRKSLAIPIFLIGVVAGGCGQTDSPKKKQVDSSKAQVVLNVPGMS